MIPNIISILKYYFKLKNLSIEKFGGNFYFKNIIRYNNAFCFVVLVVISLALDGTRPWFVLFNVGKSSENVTPNFYLHLFGYWYGVCAYCWISTLIAMKFGAVAMTVALYATILPVILFTYVLFSHALSISGWIGLCIIYVGTVLYYCSPAGAPKTDQENLMIEDDKPLIGLSGKSAKKIEEGSSLNEEKEEEKITRQDWFDLSTIGIMAIPSVTFILILCYE